VLSVGRCVVAGQSTSRPSRRAMTQDELLQRRKMRVWGERESAGIGYWVGKRLVEQRYWEAVGGWDGARLTPT